MSTDEVVNFISSVSVMIFVSASLGLILGLFLKKFHKNTNRTSPEKAKQGICQKIPPTLYRRLITYSKAVPQKYRDEMVRDIIDEYCDIYEKHGPSEAAQYINLSLQDIAQNFFIKGLHKLSTTYLNNPYARSSKKNQNPTDGNQE